MSHQFWSSLSRTWCPKYSNSDPYYQPIHTSQSIQIHRFNVYVLCVGKTGSNLSLHIRSPKVYIWVTACSYLNHWLVCLRESNSTYAFFSRGTYSCWWIGRVITGQLALHKCRRVTLWWQDIGAQCVVLPFVLNSTDMKVIKHIYDCTKCDFEQRKQRFWNITIFEVYISTK